MKLYPNQKLIGVILLVIIGIGAFSLVAAQQWYTTNQVTVAWDAVAAPNPETEQIRYDVYLANARTDPDKVNPSLVVDSTVETQETLTIGVEGRYYFGVKTERWLLATSTEPEEMVSESTIAWSDDPEAVADGATFGLRYFEPPGKAVGLRRVQ
jgi:hypothetical protein